MQELYESLVSRIRALPYCAPIYHTRNLQNREIHPHTPNLSAYIQEKMADRARPGTHNPATVPHSWEVEEMIRNSGTKVPRSSKGRGGRSSKRGSKRRSKVGPRSYSKMEHSWEEIRDRAREACRWGIWTRKRETLVHIWERAELAQEVDHNQMEPEADNLEEVLRSLPVDDDNSKKERVHKWIRVNGN